MAIETVTAEQLFTDNTGAIPGAKESLKTYPDALGMVRFDNVDLSSPYIGQSVFVAIGPSNTIKSIDEMPKTLPFQPAVGSSWQYYPHCFAPREEILTLQDPPPEPPARKRPVKKVQEEVKQVYSNAEQAKQLVQYLAALPDQINKRSFRNTRPVVVTIQAEQWHGARYDEVYEGSDQEPRDHLYLLGPLPMPKLKHKNVCFVSEQTGDKDWYVACHSSTHKMHEVGVAVKRQAEQFEPMFILATWDAPGPIDAGRRYPYHRFEMKIEDI